MIQYTLKAGSTSVILPVSIYDSSSTVGAKLAGLAYNTGSLTSYYNRTGAAGAATAITLATATKGTWATGGFVAIDGTNMPGDYELHIPNAAIAAGTTSCLVQLKGAANMVPVNILIELDAIDRQDAVRAGLTALPNAAAEAAGGLYTRGTGAGQINQTANGQIDANSVKVGGQTASASGTVTFPNATLASTTNITAGTIATVTNLTNAATAGDFTATMKTSLNSATPTVTVGDKTGFSLSTAGILAIWHQLVSAVVTASTMGKLIIDYLDAAISSRTKPADTQAAVTLVTTTTNLTNAPTSGDLTTTMKTSVTTAATAATPTAAAVTGAVGSVTGAVGSVTGNVGGNLTGSVGSVVSTTGAPKKNVALSNFAFPMFDSAGLLKTGLTVAVALRKDAGSFAASTNSASELGTTGWYTINLTQTEMNADAIAFSATATGAVPTTQTILTQA